MLDFQRLLLELEETGEVVDNFKPEEGEDTSVPENGTDEGSGEGKTLDDFPENELVQAVIDKLVEISAEGMSDPEERIEKLQKLVGVLGLEFDKESAMDVVDEANHGASVEIPLSEKGSDEAFSLKQVNEEDGEEVDAELTLRLTLNSHSSLDAEIIAHAGSESVPLADVDLDGLGEGGSDDGDEYGGESEGEGDPEEIDGMVVKGNVGIYESDENITDFKVVEALLKKKGWKYVGKEFGGKKEQYQKGSLFMVVAIDHPNYWTIVKDAQGSKIAKMYGRGTGISSLLLKVGATKKSLDPINESFSPSDKKFIVVYLNKSGQLLSRIVNHEVDAQGLGTVVSVSKVNMAKVVSALDRRKELDRKAESKKKPEVAEVAPITEDAPIVPETSTMQCQTCNEQVNPLVLPNGQKHCPGCMGELNEEDSESEPAEKPTTCPGCKRNSVVPVYQPKYGVTECPYCATTIKDYIRGDRSEDDDSDLWDRRMHAALDVKKKNELDAASSSDHSDNEEVN